MLGVWDSYLFFDSNASLLVKSICFVLLRVGLMYCWVVLLGLGRTVNQCGSSNVLEGGGVCGKDVGDFGFVLLVSGVMVMCKGLWNICYIALSKPHPRHGRSGLLVLGKTFAHCELDGVLGFC